MANEKDDPAASAPSSPVEGPTKQFSLKMTSWLAALTDDLEAPAGTPAPDAPLDVLLDEKKAAEAAEAAKARPPGPPPPPKPR